ncbi:MAG: hypothetical protein MJH10_12475 [Epibacterium sp.]|nr:hypothetical protein [Epibacterium sp.]NQX74361.1 hypothetical protein [Epibacterium sp.]
MSFIETIEGAVGAKALVAVSNTTVFGGAGAALFGWLGAVNWIGWTGVLVGLAGLSLNWWHKRTIQKIEWAKMTPEQRETLRRM